MKQCIICGKEHEGKYGSPICPACQGIATEASLNDQGVIIEGKGKHRVEGVDSIIDKLTGDR